MPVRQAPSRFPDCAAEEARAGQSTRILKEKKEKKSFTQTLWGKRCQGLNRPDSLSASRCSLRGQPRSVEERHPDPRPSLRTLVPTVDFLRHDLPDTALRKADRRERVVLIWNAPKS